jgi:hypothetical protein
MSAEMILVLIGLSAVLSVALVVLFDDGDQ